MEEALVDGKECKECGKYKSYDEFYVDSAKPDGYKYKCGACCRRIDNNKRWVRILGNIEIEWKDGELLMETFGAKVCTGCDELKSVDYFYPMEGGNQGVQALCISCDTQRHREYYYNNLEERKKYAKEYHQRPEVIKRNRETLEKDMKMKVIGFMIVLQVQLM